MMRLQSERLVSRLAIACLAVAGLALGASSVFAQATTATKTCTHEGKTYNAGDEITIEGKAMECDGNSGTWVPAEQ